jgi:uncharacterized membrane protein
MLNTRLALLELAAGHDLDAGKLAGLWRIARFGEEPAHLIYWTKRGLAMLGAALGGLGLIFWVAANWGALSRTGHFALLQGFMLAMFVGAALLPAARQALSLLALLAVGGLLAYFGQTYQTGADVWQLFAVWALAGLPLCIAARSDTVWSAWVAIAAVAVARWDYAHAGYAFNQELPDVHVHAIAWILELALPLLLSKRIGRYAGAGSWAFATAVTLSTLVVSTTAVIGLFADSIAPLFWLGLLLLAFAAALLASPHYFDIYSLSVVSLELNVLIVGALAHILLSRASDSSAGVLFLLALLAAGLLAVTLRSIQQLSRKYAGGEHE